MTTLRSFHLLLLIFLNGFSIVKITSLLLASPGPNGFNLLVLSEVTFDLCFIFYSYWIIQKCKGNQLTKFLATVSLYSMQWLFLHNSFPKLEYSSIEAIPLSFAFWSTIISVSLLILSYVLKNQQPLFIVWWLLMLMSLYVFYVNHLELSTIYHCQICHKRFGQNQHFIDIIGLEYKGKFVQRDSDWNRAMNVYQKCIQHKLFLTHTTARLVWYSNGHGVLLLNSYLVKRFLVKSAKHLSSEKHKALVDLVFFPGTIDHIENRLRTYGYTSSANLNDKEFKTLMCKLNTDIQELVHTGDQKTEYRTSYGETIDRPRIDLKKSLQL